ncbi:MAG TPA: Mrp/NBP35 family ATP-binding protein [Chitinophagales bacterium]|nr:Mrp/NBP35 family ATP-binding protein [Chitinophagales bacterium]
MAISEADILKALSNVDDPDLHKDIVSLGMVKDITIDGTHIRFTVELTTPACPMKEEIRRACVNAVKLLVSKEAEVDVNMSARVSSIRGNQEQLLPGVKNIIAVCSGKGGVGKSTVSVNLALGLAKTGAKVGIMDADIYGPSIPVMMGLKDAQPRVEEVNGKPMMIPLEAHGIKALSIGFLVDETQAVVWRGPMVSSALRQFVTDCIWGELDYLIIDLPPGTGDIHLTLVQTVPVTGAVIVTTPQEVALADARKAVGMFRLPNINVPVIGVVENMAWFTPEELPENKYFIFGTGGGTQLAKEYDVPLLAHIPLVQGIREGGDNGKPAILRNDIPVLTEAFDTLINNTARYISIRNEEKTATKIVEITR